MYDDLSKERINFLKPAYGNALKCRSKLISKGRQIIVSESRVYDVRDKSEKSAAKGVITIQPTSTMALTSVILKRIAA